MIAAFSCQQMSAERESNPFLLAFLYPSNVALSLERNDVMAVCKGEVDTKAGTGKKQESDQKIYLASKGFKEPDKRCARGCFVEKHIVFSKTEINISYNKNNQKKNAQNPWEAMQIGTMCARYNQRQRYINQ